MKKKFYDINGNEIINQQCKKCHEIKDKSEFRVINKELTSWCAACISQKNKELNALTFISTSIRRYMTKHKFLKN